MKALICGVTGQDGSYLAELLLSKGYEVIGTSRDAMITPFSNLLRLNIREHVQTTSMAINDFRSVLGVVQRFKPDEIYNLAGQTSVGLSFEQPVESMESIAQGTLNMLEVIRLVDRPIRFYSAGSSECSEKQESILLTRVLLFDHAVLMRWPRPQRIGLCKTTVSLMVSLHVPAYCSTMSLRFAQSVL